MTTTSLLAIRPHGDLAKFEFEDHLLRGAVPQLLRSQNGISSVTVDLRIETQSSGDTPQDLGAMITVIETNSDRSAVRELREMVFEAGEVEAAWEVDDRRATQSATTWLGTSTPGVKSLCFVRMPADSDSPDHHRHLVETAGDLLHDRLPQAEISTYVVTADLVPSPVTTAVFTMLFRSVNAIDEARQAGAFAPIEDLVERHEATVFELRTVEHRLFPNPNTWLGDDDLPPVESVSIA